MALRLVATAACLAALGSGCIIREIREIHHEPAANAGACTACASAPGSVLADSQPPAPMVEEAGEPPGQDYVWVDGYWHWNGAEWIWITGRWVPPMGEFAFVPPSYYASGSDCVYVPGYWQRGPRSPYPIRDHRPVSMRDHSHGGSHHSHRPHRIGDHRGDKPTSPPGSLGGKSGEGDEIVVTIPGKPRPDKAAPPRAATPSPSSPASRPPAASAPPAGPPARPTGPPPAQARPGPGPARVAPPSGPARVAPPPSSPPPRGPSPGPARVAPPPPKAAPPASKPAPPSAQPRPAAPSRPAPPSGGSSKKK